MLLGQILAEMGMREGREVSWLPSYGPEMRSGSAHCYVCLSKERVGSPLVEHPDLLIAMNEISLRKFAREVDKHGTILYGSAILPAGLPTMHAQVLCVPAAEIADSLGTTKAANMVMLGALLEATGTLPKETASAVLGSRVHNAKLLEVDCRAIDAGMACIRKQLNRASSIHSPEEALASCS